MHDRSSLTLTALPHLDLLRCAGADATTFLQGQLTQDLRRLDRDSTLLAGLNTPQGRVVATPWLRLHEDAVWLLLPADQAEAVAVRLRRYVLRAKVAIERVEDCTLVGSESALPAAGPEFQLPDGRRVTASPRGSPVPAGGSSADWRLRDVRAGLPMLCAATSEQFVAQMLNLDLLGAISFDKGCYTGQEIVARTQHLGRIKRRMLRYRVAGAEPPAVLDGLHDDALKVGEVLVAAPDGDACEVLAVVQVEARDRPLRTADGRTAVPLALPYRA